MKIFVGGLLPARQQAMKQAFPDVNFEFASDQEGWKKWLAKAKRADVVVLDQGRCNHTIVDLLQKARVPYQFADGTASIKQLIERAIT